MHPLIESCVSAIRLYAKAVQQRKQRKALKKSFTSKFSITFSPACKKTTLRGMWYIPWGWGRR